MKRVSVIRNERIVPLFPDRPVNTNICSPLSGLLLETHDLGAVEVPEHEHSSFCLHLQTSGSVEMEWWSEGRHGKESHRTGSIVLVTPGTRDRMRWDRRSRPVLISIDESYLVRAAQELGTKNRLAITNRWMFEDRQIQLLMTEFRREMEADWETGSLYHEHLAMSLSLALIRKYSQGTTISPIAKGGISGVRLQRVFDFIAANSRQDIALEDIAIVAGMSKFHFARLFRLRMGITPYRYLMNQRLERAKALMRLEARTMAEIADATGFTSSRHLSRAFRRYLGVSPSEWKRHI